MTTLAEVQEVIKIFIIGSSRVYMGGWGGGAWVKKMGRCGHSYDLVR